MRALLWLGLFCSLIVTAVIAGPSGYRVTKTYKLGGDGGWDYLTVDSKSRRVYISRGTHVMVVDAFRSGLARTAPHSILRPVMH